jgi:hypothetical protein
VADRSARGPLHGAALPACCAIIIHRRTMPRKRRPASAEPNAKSSQAAGFGTAFSLELHPIATGAIGMRVSDETGASDLDAARASAVGFPKRQGAPRGCVSGTTVPDIVDGGCEALPHCSGVGRESGHALAATAWGAEESPPRFRLGPRNPFARNDAAIARDWRPAHRPALFGAGPYRVWDELTRLASGRARRLETSPPATRARLSRPRVAGSGMT